MVIGFFRLAILSLVVACVLDLAQGQDAVGKADTRPAGQPTSDVQSALQRLKLPGIQINLAERCVDVASEVCLDQGMLELIACTKGSKEHESIITVDAKAVHIHTALLLLGAKSGNPAMRKQVGEKEPRWVDIPPRGGFVDVFLVIGNENGGGKPVERPISDFIGPSDPGGVLTTPGKPARKTFPTHTFLFAGSHLVTQGDGPRTYVCDRSGNVISIATFGDELLCLPGVHSHAKGELLWQVDASHLPPVGTKVTLRLRPRLDTAEKRRGDRSAEKVGRK